MSQIRFSNQAKWWCVHFGSEAIDPLALKKLHFFLKRYSSHQVLGKQRVFLDMSESNGRHAFSLFQKKVTEIAERLNISTESWQWGRGKSLAESWVHARWRSLSLELLPLEAITDFLNPLQLSKVSPSHLRRVQQLRVRGIASMQDLIDLPDESLESQAGVWIAEFARDHFERPKERRDAYLDRMTSESFAQSSLSFQLEDWIPQEYLQVG